MEDINLDFLSSPPRRSEQQLERPLTPIASNRFSNVFHTKNKRLHMAEKIAKVDELVREIERFKLDNNELKRQLKDFQKTAADVQNMYSEEKKHHEIVKNELKQLRQKYDVIDSDLANKTMVYDQMSARLAEYEGRPIDYNSLLVKFVKIMQKVDGEDFLRYSQDKTLVEELKQYCLKMNLKIPIMQSPKKGRSKAVKPKTVNASVQCSDLGVNHSQQKPVMHDQFTQCLAARLEPTNKVNEHLGRPEMKSQYTECQVTRRDQASQYISTMITRQTNTEKIVQKHVSTMFPEPKPIPPINDILNVFCKWADIRSITPLENSPKSKQSNKVLKTSTTTGTCTMLCNIRRRIDYLSPFGPGIKQELTTPSPSPIPTSNSTSGPSTRPQPSSGHANMNNQNHLPNSILTLFNANSNTALGQLSTTAFNELWQIFGTMLLSLLQTSNAGIANISQNSINQQQFLDWLLELYMNSQLSSTTSTQTVANQVISTQTSPLRFDDSSVLSSANIVRPQVKKSFATELCTSSENENTLQSQLSGDNLSQFIETTTLPPLTDEHYSQDSNSNDIEIQNIQATANIRESETNFNQSIKSRKSSKKSRENKTNHKLLEEIQELLPEAKLNKKKRKALKRLLNKPKKNKRVEILMNHQDTDNNHIETAVDFLKMFAQDQGEFQNHSHTNGTNAYKEMEMSTQNCSFVNVEKSPKGPKESSVQRENVEHFVKPVACTSLNDEFTFIKPSISQTQSLQHKGNFCNSTFIKPAEKPKKSYINKRIENKYQILFGDSDNEIDEEDGIPQRHTNPVISDEDFVNINENPLAQTLENSNCSRDIISEPSSLQILTDNSYTIKDNKNSLDQTTSTTFQQTKNNIFMDITSQEQFSLPEISTPLLEDLMNMSSFKSVFSKLETETNVVAETELSEPMEDFTCHIQKDLELSSDEEATSEESYQQTKTKLMPSRNESYKLETDTKKQQNLPVLPDNKCKYKTATNNSLIEKQTKNYNNVEFSYNTNFSLPPTTDLCTQPDMDLKYSSKSKYDCTDNLENNQTKHTEEKTLKQSSNYESFSVAKTYTSDFEKDFEMSSDNESVLTETDNQAKDELRPNYKIESSSAKDSSSETDEIDSPSSSQNVEQDSQENGLQQTLPERAKTTHNKLTSFDRASSSPKLSNLKTLPDFKDTFSQKTNNSNSHIINKEQNVPHTKLSTVNEQEELASTTTNASTDNSSLSSSFDEDEISVIEISSDLTGLDNDREPENDLIIDEDYSDKTNEVKFQINRNQSRTNSPTNDELSTNENYSSSGSEDHNYSKSKLNDCSKTESLRDTLDSSTISTLLNSSLYNEVLTDSISPIVCDLLKEEVILKTPPHLTKDKRGRKRKSECLIEQPQPCKRSQRLKAKQLVLEQTLDISECCIEIGKYTRNRRNSNRDFKPINIEETKKKTGGDTKIDLKLEMGFFLERSGQQVSKRELTLNGDKNLEAEQKNSIDVDPANVHVNDSTIQGQLPSNTETPCETTNTDHTNYVQKTTLNEVYFNYSESPKSPMPANSNDDQLDTTYTINIPLERPSQYLPQRKNATLFDTLINSYSADNQKSIQSNAPAKIHSRQQHILQQLQMDIEMYCNSEMQLDPDHTANNLINNLLKKTEDYELIQKAILNVAKMAESSRVPEMELPSIIQELPPRHLSCCLQRLFVVLKHFLNRNTNFCQELIIRIEKLLFATQMVVKLSLQATLNLTQLYLSACKQQESVPSAYKHSARLFIAKCLYYYSKKAILMVHEVLLWYPTVLPHREDQTYDRSDALITVIQEILMNTRYDMENQELRGRTLISKLRFEYHYDAYSPTLDEVLVNLVEKLKNTKFYNISMAFGLLCKRLQPEKVQEKFLNAHLLPLANEYYNKALLTLEYDKRIAVLLEIISMIVKPFPVETNVEVYLNEFSRFLNGFDRPVIQEAALCSILRLQRFGSVNCFNYLHHFKPTFELETHTQAMLKTFLHRKPLTFWKTIKAQNPRNNL